MLVTRIGISLLLLGLIGVVPSACTAERVVRAGCEALQWAVDEDDEDAPPPPTFDAEQMNRELQQKIQRDLDAIEQPKVEIPPPTFELSPPTVELPRPTLDPAPIVPPVDAGSVRPSAPAIAAEPGSTGSR